MHFCSTISFKGLVLYQVTLRSLSQDFLEGGFVGPIGNIEGTRVGVGGVSPLPSVVQ